MTFEERALEAAKKQRVRNQRAWARRRRDIERFTAAFLRVSPRDVSSEGPFTIYSGFYEYELRVVVNGRVFFVQGSWGSLERFRITCQLHCAFCGKQTRSGEFRSLAALGEMLAGEIQASEECRRNHL